MNQKISNLLVLVLIVEIILLSGQAEPVTATIGYIYAVLFAIALTVQMLKGK